MVSDSSKTLFKPGQKVLKAGIYNVLHAEHRLPHKVSFKAKGKFPLCKQCGDRVRFELVTETENGAKLVP
jgi:hypothetical protein